MTMHKNILIDINSSIGSLLYGWVRNKLKPINATFETLKLQSHILSFQTELGGKDLW